MFFSIVQKTKFEAEHAVTNRVLKAYDKNKPVYEKITIGSGISFFYLWCASSKQVGTSDKLPLPQGEDQYNYVKRLAVECKKLRTSEKVSSVYLFYFENLLNKEHQAILNQLTDDIPNLFILGYCQLINAVSDQDNMKQKVLELGECFYTQYEISSKITYLVDFIRFPILYYYDVAKIVALDKYSNCQEKLAILNNATLGMIYSEFDVFLLGKNWKMQQMEFDDNQRGFYFVKGVSQYIQQRKFAQNPRLCPQLFKFFPDICLLLTIQPNNLMIKEILDLQAEKIKEKEFKFGDLCWQARKVMRNQCKPKKIKDDLMKIKNNPVIMEIDNIRNYQTFFQNFFVTHQRSYRNSREKISYGTYEEAQKVIEEVNAQNLDDLCNDTQNTLDNIYQKMRDYNSEKKQSKKAWRKRKIGEVSCVAEWTQTKRKCYDLAR